MLRHGAVFLEDPSKIKYDNCDTCCNLHITPALEGIMIEVHSLEEVAHWVKKGHLGYASDPTEPGTANLVVALGNNPWPHTLGLAWVLVALGQKLCSLTEAMNSTKEHFGREKGLEAAHYYLTLMYTEAPYLLSDDGTATVIGAAAFGVSPGDNVVDLSTLEGATTNLVL